MLAEHLVLPDKPILQGNWSALCQGSCPTHAVVWPGHRSRCIWAYGSIWAGEEAEAGPSLGCGQCVAYRTNMQRARRHHTSLALPSCVRGTMLRHVVVGLHTPSGLSAWKMTRPLQRRVTPSMLANIHHRPPCSTSDASMSGSWLTVCASARAHWPRMLSHARWR